MSRARPTRSDFAVWRRFTTRWSDNDVYGHVNNVIYYQWFDSAVNAWLVEAGLLNMEASDRIALVVETSCTYFGPLSYPQDVEVGLRAAHIGRSSTRYSIGVFANGATDAAAAGEFIHVLVARETRQPVDMPPEWRSALKGIS